MGITLLAGVGFDDLVNRKRLGRSLLAFAVFCLVLCAATVLVVDVGLTAPSRSVTSGVYAKLLDALPWSEPGVYPKIVRDASRPNMDFRVQESWARQGVVLKSSPRPVFDELRFAIYRQELTGTLAILGVLVVVAWLGSRKRAFPAALVVVALADLFLNGRPKRIDHGPIASLIEQSPTLKRLSKIEGHPRTLDPLHNLPMVADVAPLSAYRTLDLPVVTRLTRLAMERPSNPAEAAKTVEAAKLATASVRVFDPAEALEIDRKGGHWPNWNDLETTVDPTLAGWTYGADWIAQQGGRIQNYRIARLNDPDRFGWLVPANPAVVETVKRGWNRLPEEILSTLKDAVPLTSSATSEGELELVLPAIAGRPAEEPRLIVICQLDDPQWEATWKGQPIPTFRAFGIEGEGAWTGLIVPSNREERLLLRYDGRDIREGWWISGVSLLIWGAAFLRGVGAKREL